MDTQRIMKDVVSHVSSVDFLLLRESFSEEVSSFSVVESEGVSVSFRRCPLLSVRQPLRGSNFAHSKLHVRSGEE